LLNFQVSNRLDPEVPTMLGLGYAQVLEIVEPSELLPVPFAPPYVLGVTLWRDRVTPIVDLAQRLRLPPPAGGPKRWAIARATSSGELIGFPVQPNVQSLRLPAPHRVSEFAERVDMALGVFDLEDRTVVVPDLAAAAHFG
jgi:chemotaxis signal transduction protein